MKQLNNKNNNTKKIKMNILEITLKIDITNLADFSEAEEVEWVETLLHPDDLFLISSEIGDDLGKTLEVVNYKINNL